MNNLIFIGGIHGAGKGTICNKICKKTNMVHLTASEILKWREISKIENKDVENIQSTQDILITGLRNLIKEGEIYLLDGHFCLFNSKGKVEKIPEETFKKIDPKLIVVVIADIHEIQRRLKRRDKKTYNLDTLKEMQIMEKEHAKRISLILDVPFIAIKDNNYSELIKFTS